MLILEMLGGVLVAVLVGLGMKAVYEFIISKQGRKRK